MEYLIWLTVLYILFGVATCGAFAVYDAEGELDGHMWEVVLLWPIVVVFTLAWYLAKEIKEQFNDYD